jgi:biopolymer transport protein ExbD
MWPLGAFSIAVVALAIYNITVLRRGEFCPPPLVETLRRQMGEFQLRNAVEDARASPAYLGRMLARSLPAMDPNDAETLGREQVHETISEFAERTNGQSTSGSSSVMIERMLITVDDRGAIELNGRVLRPRPGEGLIPELAERLRRYQSVARLSGTEPQVLIQCAEAAAEQRFIDVLGACRRAEIDRISILD